MCTEGEGVRAEGRVGSHSWCVEGVVKLPLHRGQLLISPRGREELKGLAYSLALAKGRQGVG